MVSGNFNKSVLCSKRKQNSLTAKKDTMQLEGFPVFCDVDCFWKCSGEFFAGKFNLFYH